MKRFGKYLLPIMGGAILLGIMGACSSKTPNNDGKETSAIAADTPAAEDAVVEEDTRTSGQDIQAKKEFLEVFYQGLDESDLDPSYIKKYVTPKALQILKDYYGYDCDDGDCLGAWLFVYACNDDPGALVSRHIKEVNENDYLVEIKYEWYEYAVQLTVIKDGDTCKIDNIEMKRSVDLSAETTDQSMN